MARQSRRWRPVLAVMRDLPVLIELKVDRLAGQIAERVADVIERAAPGSLRRDEFRRADRGAAVPAGDGSPGRPAGHRRQPGRGRYHRKGCDRARAGLRLCGAPPFRA
jgi:hypothetical protein